MGGSSNANDYEFVEESITIVLVGCTGTGKSSTGNSIIGQKVFKSMSSFGGVISSCKLQTTRLLDGRIVNVIDTPGLFDSASRPQHIEKEIVRCMDMARDGIDAILIVVSLNGRFSEEQVAAVDTLKHLFGEEMVDYMIVAFTGGDELEDDETLDDRLASSSCPDALTELLDKCGNRRALFDNKTKDESKKALQLQQLFNLISKMVEEKGKFTNKLFLELKKKESEEQMMLRITEFVHEKPKENQLEIIKKLEEDIKKLEEDMGRAHLENEIGNLKRQLEEAQRKINQKWGCSVM